jgi:cyclase
VLLESVRAAVSVPIVASGGGRTPGHLAEAVKAGADAVLAASIFHDRQTTVSELKRALRDEQGMEVRL